MNFDLRVRDLQKNLEGTQTFGSVDTAKAWLKDRPQFIEVLGVASSHISKDVGDELKACMRALDEEEKQLMQELAKSAEEARRQRAEAMREASLAEAERHRAEMAAADPNRPMDVHYRFDVEMSLVDVADAREITPEAREAVMEWIKERNTWVESRGQVVGAAKVRVWPGPIPEGEDARVLMGNFVPVTGSDEDD